MQIADGRHSNDGRGRGARLIADSHETHHLRDGSCNSRPTHHGRVAFSCGRGSGTQSRCWNACRWRATRHVSSSRSRCRADTAAQCRSLPDLAIGCLRAAGHLHAVMQVDSCEIRGRDRASGLRIERWLAGIRIMCGPPLPPSRRATDPRRSRVEATRRVW